MLGSLFSHLKSRAQIPNLLKAFETLRLTRTAATQQSSRLNRTIFHLPDGPAQLERDRDMAATIPRGENTDSANQWADKVKNDTQFEYDADLDAERWWVEHGAEVERLSTKHTI